MSLKDLREALEYLEKRGMLAMVKAEMDPHLEVAEIARRVMYRRYPLRCLAYPSPKQVLQLLRSNILDHLYRRSSQHGIVGT